MERICLFGYDESLVGILCEGEQKDTSNNLPGIIILNAGLIHRIGPNGIFTKLARVLSVNGYDVLRFDHSGIGDSQYRKDSVPFLTSSSEEVSLAMKLMEKIKQKTKFIIIGLCSGGAGALNAAFEDRRVIGIVMINPMPLETSIGKELQGNLFYEKNALFKFKSWVRLFTGKSNYSAIWRAVTNRIGKIHNKADIRRFDKNDKKNLIKSGFEEFLLRGTHVLILSSGGDPGLEYIRRQSKNIIKTMTKKKTLQIKIIQEADHTFTTLNVQRKMLGIIQTWINKICKDIN